MRTVVFDASVWVETNEMYHLLLDLYEKTSEPKVLVLANDIRKVQVSRIGVL